MKRSKVDLKEFKSYLDTYGEREKELDLIQQDYNKLLHTRNKNRIELVQEKSLEKTIDLLTKEKEDLQAKIYVAKGSTHVRRNKAKLEMVRCQVKCYENLTTDIKKLKMSNADMKKENGRLDREIQKLNSQIVPDNQFLAHVDKIRRKRLMYKNTLESNTRRECAMTDKNAKLRTHIIEMLTTRKIFEEKYVKQIAKLNSNQRYLIELCEYLMHVLDRSVEMSDRLSNHRERFAEDFVVRQWEMQQSMLAEESNRRDNNFLMTRDKKRRILPMQDKERRRRAHYKADHSHKIDLYENIIQRLLNFSGLHDIDQLLNNYEEQEALYFSYFNHSNEMSYHLTLLGNSLFKLYDKIQEARDDNQKRLESDEAMIVHIGQKIKKQKKRNRMVGKYMRGTDEQVDLLLAEMQDMFKIAGCDLEKVRLVAEDGRVKGTNVRLFMKVLETRIFRMLITAFMGERESVDSIGEGPLLVARNDKLCDRLPTEIDDIVLTTQCPECAEVEVTNVDETLEDFVAPHTEKETKELLYEKVVQPEMQYRLHSLSACRLPRSRALAAKRDGA